MQRRGAQRSSGTRNASYSSSSVDANDKKKRRKISSSVFYAVGLFVILVVCLPLVLTPSQKKELSEVEQAIWRQYQQQTTGSQVEQQSISNNKEDDDDDVEEGDNKAVDGEGKPLEEQHDDKEDTSANNADANGAPPNAATARMEAQSSRWVDGEKALKKKLMVLYEQQMKGKYLGVPVVTRYLGEDIPAYIGTPDSPMAEDEWKKLVEAKYEEMRLEEEEWRKKMEALIATRERDMGITTA